MAQLQTDLSEFVGLLNSHGVEYLVVGGHAVAFHGHPRLTGDIDFFLRATELGRPPNRIDLLTSISGVSFEDAWPARVPGQLGEHTVSFIGWDELIRNKKASDRDKDRLDVKKLNAIRAKRSGA